MKFHQFCLLFPQATDKELQEISDDILRNGQNDPIITYEGEILDGRNRFLACELAGVEPVFVEYKGDDPLGFVMTKNMYRRHMSESQTAMLAQKYYHMRKEQNPTLTMKAVAEQFEIGERTLQRADRVADTSSEAVKKQIDDGKLAIKTVEKALTKAQEKTGIKVTKNTPEPEKKKVQKIQEEILNNAEPDRPEEKPLKNNADEEFHAMVVGGVFDGKRWEENIRLIQETTTAWGRMPGLFRDSLELIDTVNQEICLKMVLDFVIDSVEKVLLEFKQLDKTIPNKERMDTIERQLITFFKEISKLDPNEAVLTGQELLVAIHGKYIESCEQIITEAKAIRKELPAGPHWQETANG